MITCRFCGTKNEDETYFCEKCGKLLEPKDASPPAPAPVHPVTSVQQAGAAFCHKCGAAIPSGASFCPGCGARLAAIAETRTPPFNPPSGVSPPESPPVSSMRPIAEFTVSPFAVDWHLAVGAAGPLRGGKLEIYADRLRFAPNSVNLVDKEYVIPFSDIASVELCSIMMMPTAVKIRLKNGDERIYQSGVAGIGCKREEIAAAIKRAMSTGSHG
jgi:hypothetical protein